MLDERMLPFAEGLQKHFINAASHCTRGEVYDSPCSSEVMGLSGPAGAEAMRLFPGNGEELDPMLKFNFFASKRPLIFGSGFGTTGTHELFDATCALGLRSVHYALDCGFKVKPPNDTSTVDTSTVVVSGGLLAHERLLRAHLAVEACIFAGHEEAVSTCPTVNETLHSMRSHIDSVILSLDVDVIHDTPYPEYAEYVLEAAERIRRSKPIILLSEREPDEWAGRRVERGFGYNCKVGSDFSPLGSRIYSCLQSAVENGLGASPVSDVLTGRYMEMVPSDEGKARGQAMAMGMQTHQNAMRAIAEYKVNLFGVNKTSTPALGQEIVSAIAERLRGTGVVASLENALPHHKLKPGWFTQPQRTCMTSLKSALKSGRHCDKLILFLHFHKASGTSMLEYLSSRGLRHNLYAKVKDGSDMFVAPSTHSNLRLLSAAPVTRASTTDFWWSLYKRGLDVVSLEYNFLKPTDYFKVQSEFWTITMLRNPWDRFRSTYERELQLACKKKGRSRDEELACFNTSKLESWMVNNTGVMSEKRGEFWGGILHPNYYVRLLNGIGDVPGEVLDRSHLDAAKRVLDSFDLVLIVEDSDASKKQHLCEFLGVDTYSRKEPHCKLDMPKASNNDLKSDPMYQSIRMESDRMRPMFDERNSLDIELYEYARSVFLKK